MSMFNPSLSNNISANSAYAHTAGLNGRRTPPVRVQVVQTEPAATQAPKKSGILKKLLIGGLTIGTAALAFKQFKPDAYGKLAQSLKTQFPSVTNFAEEGKNYTIAQYNAMKGNSMVESAINAVKPAWDSVQNLVKKWA